MLGAKSATLFASARHTGIPRKSLEELGLLLYLYAGFPAAIEFLRALERAWPARTLSRRPASYAAWRTWQKRGEVLCRRVYGDRHERLRRFTEALHPDLDLWMIVEGYGKTLSRPGLGIVEKELATVAALAALDWPRQLAAHREGARRVGAHSREVAWAETLGERCRTART